MSLGLRFNQKLQGTYHQLRDPGSELPIVLDIDIELPFLALLRGNPGHIRGRIRAEEYANAPLVGTFHIHIGTRKIVYEARFEALDGRQRRFHGETVFELRRPVRTIEDLIGRIYDDDREEARVLLHVPLDIGLRRIFRSLRASVSRTV